jgi:predicted esterase
LNLLLRFDIRTLDKISAENQEDEAGLLQSKGEIDKLIANEIDGGVPSERILLGGFSQGAALTLLPGLTTERKLAGLAVLSGYIPIRTKTKAVSNYIYISLTLFLMARLR